ELDELATMRRNVPAMTERARLTGRWLLEAEFRKPQRRPRGVLLWRIALPAAALVVVTAGVLGYQAFGPSGGQPTASAAETLEAAAAAVDPGLDPIPRPDQYIYREELHVISNGKQTRVRSWESADGTRAGEIRTSGLLNNVIPIQPYRAGDSLAEAPYL